MSKAGLKARIDEQLGHGLDREPTERLAKELLASIRDHFADRPRARETVLEILNALAAVTATVVAGTDDEALEFFLDALSQNAAVAIEKRNYLTQ